MAASSGAPPQAGRRFAPYERFAAGKTSAQGQFTCPEHAKSSPGAPTKSQISWGSPKQLEELNIVCTKKEEDEAE